MSRAKYSAEFKSRIVLAIIQGDKDFNTICSENNLNPGMVRKWRIELLKNAHKAFDHEAALKWHSNLHRREKRTCRRSTIRC